MESSSLARACDLGWVGDAKRRRGGASLFLFLLLSGCGDSTEQNPASGMDGGGGDVTVIDGGGLDGMGGDTAPPGCDASKDPKDSPACVDDTFGVFVSARAANDTGDGSKAHPVQKIATALTKLSASKTRIYVCAGTYAEDVLIDATHDGTSVFGGWNCADWSYTGTKPVIGAGANALKLDSLTKPVVIEDVEVDAADQSAVPGGSSIAAFVNGSASVTFSRLTLGAGPGGGGANSVFTSYTFPAVSAGATGGATTGGIASAIACPGGDSTQGGNGGNAGFQGTDGLPALGAGAKGTVAVCNMGGGGSGGANAPAVTDGAGATTSGTLVAGAWAPQAGKPGMKGSAGQGGGGGYGSAGGAGAGGQGGCGGAAGTGGKGGGGSIAVVSFSSTLKIVGSTITAKAGGGGGAGHAGQAGQQPLTDHGNGAGCSGGDGGNGANGSASGGGAGGLSVGVLYQGNKPTTDSTTITTGTFGAAGIGGASPANDGKPGVKADVQDATTL